jgi:hypothetical protein
MKDFARCLWLPPVIIIDSLDEPFLGRIAIKID